MQKQVEVVQLVQCCSVTYLPAVQFWADQHGEHIIKRHQPIAYPLHLDLTQRCSPELKLRNGGLFSLSGVLVHEGSSPWAGHYFGYFKQPSQRWLRFNDSTVQEVSEQEVCGLKSLAFMLLYEAAPEFVSLR